MAQRLYTQQILKSLVFDPDGHSRVEAIWRAKPASLKLSFHHACRVEYTTTISVYELDALIDLLIDAKNDMDVYTCDLCKGSFLETPGSVQVIEKTQHLCEDCAWSAEEGGAE